MVYAMALLAVLSVAGLLLFELALSPKARYPLTVTRVQQVQQVLRGEEVQQGEGVLVPYGEGEASFPMNINQATAEDLMEADRIGEKRAQDILDFIANGIHKHRGVVKIFFHNSFKIFFPDVRKYQRSVKRLLVLCPGVKRLLHHQHADPVAGVQQRFRGRIMGKTHGIESRLLQQLDPALLCPREGCRPHRPVVMVDTAAAQQDLLPVDQQSVLRIQRKAADPEGAFRRIQRPGKPRGDPEQLPAAAVQPVRRDGR